MRKPGLVLVHLSHAKGSPWSVGALAIYHLNAKIISRKTGRSSTAAAAYRAGVRIEDERTGEVHDYTRKRGVASAEILTPEGAPDWANDRSELWNRVEAKNKRGDAQVAREIIVALPAELDEAQRADLARRFGREIASRYNVGVDLAIHAPGKDGDNRNHHAHLLLTTNRLDANGLGNKVRDFDKIAAQRTKGDDGEKAPNAVIVLRERWAVLTNEALERAGRTERIDHRSLKDQGIEDRAPTAHRGPRATAIERRTKQPSRRRVETDRPKIEAETRAALRAVEAEAGALDAELARVAGQVERIQEKRAEVERIKAELDAGRRAVRSSTHDEGRDMNAEIAETKAKAKETETETQRTERRLLAEIEAQGGSYDQARAQLVAGVRERIEPDLKRQHQAHAREIEERRQHWAEDEPSSPRLFGKAKAEEAKKAWVAEGRKIDREAREHEGRSSRLGAHAQGQARDQVKQAYPELWRRAEAEKTKDTEAKASEYLARRQRERELERERGRSR